MDLKDGETATNIGLVEHHLAIKATGTQQRRIKDIGAVGGGDDNNIGLFIKAVQLNKQLIERLFAFVVAACTRTVSMTTNGVYLIDEDDAGCMLFGLFEKVAHTCRTNSDEHFHKFRSAN